MAKITAFVMELVRAANEFERLGDFEKRRLLDRAYRIIEEGRSQIGMARDRTDSDAAIDLLTMSRAPDSFTQDEIKEALLDAADMLRTIKIVLDAKEDVLTEGE